MTGFTCLLHVMIVWFFYAAQFRNPDAIIDSTCRRNSGSKLCRLNMHQLWVSNSNRYMRYFFAGCSQWKRLRERMLGNRTWSGRRHSLQEMKGLNYFTRILELAGALVIDFSPNILAGVDGLQLQHPCLCWRGPSWLPAFRKLTEGNYSNYIWAEPV